MRFSKNTGPAVSSVIWFIKVDSIHKEGMSPFSKHMLQLHLITMSLSQMCVRVWHMVTTAESTCLSNSMPRAKSEPLTKTRSTM